MYKYGTVVTLSEGHITKSLQQKYDWLKEKRSKMMVWCFMSLSTLFKSYWDDGNATMTGSVQCSTIQFCLQLDSNSRPCDPMSRVLTTRPPGYFRKGVNIKHVAPDNVLFQQTVQIFLHKNLCCGYTFEMQIFFLFLHETVSCKYSSEASHWGVSNIYQTYVFRE